MLARAATTLRCHHLEVPELAEAAAALQDLAVGLAEEAAAAARLAELAALQSGGNQQIQVLPDGPYLAVNPSHLYDHLGVPIPARPLMALCRCGESGIKPTCDGTCHRIGFTERKDPQPGRRPARLLYRPAGNGAGQPRPVPALRVVHRPARLGVPPRSGAVRQPERRADGRNHPGGTRLPVRRAELRAGTPSRRGRRSTTPASGSQAIEVSLDGPYRITGGLPIVNGSGEDVARNEGRFPGALRAVPVRALPEQAVLFGHALVRRLPRSAARP